MPQHNEKAFESAIEDYLLTKSGYTKASSESFDRQRCLDPTILIPFIQETQPKEWEYLKNIQKEKAEETLISDLTRALDSEHEGCIKVLRHGFKCFGKLFRVAYFAPASRMNPETQRLYKENKLTITRQLHYSEKHEKTIDVVLGLNGIPVVTAELK
ncbi:MAG: type I restriction enzyme HsdR N-terminal domain-containing protein, partial [ANME-2 cluster archaeon]|nr:type I restriction enzyme HsdR N-terminal domain-containing protein [ANME-2 cluster archaeon]